MTDHDRLMRDAAEAMVADAPEPRAFDELPPAATQGKVRNTRLVWVAVAAAALVAVVVGFALDLGTDDSDVSTSDRSGEPAVSPTTAEPTTELPPALDPALLEIPGTGVFIPVPPDLFDFVMPPRLTEQPDFTVLGFSDSGAPPATLNLSAWVGDQRQFEIASSDDPAEVESFGVPGSHRERVQIGDYCGWYFPEAARVSGEPLGFEDRVSEMLMFRVADGVVVQITSTSLRGDDLIGYAAGVVFDRDASFGGATGCDPDRVPLLRILEPPPGFTDSRSDEAVVWADSDEVTACISLGRPEAGDPPAEPLARPLSRTILSHRQQVGGREGLVMRTSSGAPEEACSIASFEISGAPIETLQQAQEQINRAIQDAGLDFVVGRRNVESEPSLVCPNSSRGSAAAGGPERTDAVAAPEAFVSSGALDDGGVPISRAGYWELILDSRTVAFGFAASGEEVGHADPGR